MPNRVLLVSPGQPGRSSGVPLSPPAKPPPSVLSRHEPVPCTVSALAGPMPGVPNIRIVVTAGTRVDMLWACVREGSRTIQGTIALAGGRGEQIVDAATQVASVTVCSDPSMAGRPSRAPTSPAERATDSHS